MKAKLLLLLTSCLAFSLFANNIVVTDPSLTGQIVANHTVQVEFKILWNNSWRTSTAVPLNWDAAWVFVKYKVDGDQFWRHAKISTAGYVEPTDCTIDVASDSTGAFIYRASDGSGSVLWDNVQLQWAYGANGVEDDAQVEIKIFAIEMVYIPAGPFYIGDGEVETGRGQFHITDTEDPYLVSSEGAIQCGTGNGYLSANHAFASGEIPPAYPKGFNAYYCMKYEISQDQYREFLNTLTRTQQNYHTSTDISGTSVTNYFVMPNSTSPLGDNGIRCETSLPSSGSITFYMDLDNDGIFEEANDGHTHPANYLRWMDIAAYLDWAALRPITELEFEKACRGPKFPTPSEFPWGSSRIHAAQYTITDFGHPLEEISDPGVYKGNVLYSATKPSTTSTLRCGIFAASAVNTNREETGAGYFGCMELAGNVHEQLVRAGYNAGRSYTGLHGDGQLNTAGHADTDYWPGINGNTNVSIANTAYNPAGNIGVTGWAGACFAGGYFGTAANDELRTSDRLKRSQYASTFLGYWGGRGGRTAP